MLEKILKMYAMAMATGVRTPVPHLFGPPGCGKSTVVQQAADIIGVQLHVINVSRISPLELEGVQMPHSGEGEEEMYLKLLTATFWTQLKDADILLFDEFLRGFPEVYNGLLDIFTSRQVGGFQLPEVFIIAASNSTVSYDKALEDRLLHLPVPDPRSSKRAKADLAKLLVDQVGLLPEMVLSMEMQTLLDSEVLPMYEVLDSLKSKAASPVQVKGCSLRNLIGQALLREVKSHALRELISMNNMKAMQKSQPQYVFLTKGTDVKSIVTYEDKAKGLPTDKLTPLQRLNMELNLQLVELERIRYEKEGTDEDEQSPPDDPF